MDRGQQVQRRVYKQQGSNISIHFSRERESGVGAREPEDGLADWNVTHTHIYICYTPKTYLFGLARHIVKQCAGASEDQLL